ncbi:hypothetical protein GCM10020001_034960 [Nonomuraea salmonea]
MPHASVVFEWKAQVGGQALAVSEQAFDRCRIPAGPGVGEGVDALLDPVHELLPGRDVVTRVAEVKI